jgi:hypothetical protein
MMDDAWDFVAANWDTAAGLAVSMFALTLAAGALVRPQHKDSIALWLMGAETDSNWVRGFVSLFDALFGEKHFTLHCMLRSALASLLAVALIWVLMGELGTFGTRFDTNLSLGGFLIAVLAVNLVADYLSLLETRWLLGWLEKGRSPLVQVGVLALDLLFSAGIIWLALVAYLNSPLNQGEVESFAEILGVFSIFSVLFYSTFLTSIWSWSYILSALVMRLLRRARLGDWLNVAEKPILVLACVLAGIVFLGALGLGSILQKSEDGVTLAERGLCSVFKGRVCLDVAKLTDTEQRALDFILLACAGGVTAECFRRGLDSIDLQPAQAARLFGAACAADDARGCTGLGVLHFEGLGVAQDDAEAARLYGVGCAGGYAQGCTNLGFLHHGGLGVAQDDAEAARLYGVGCAGGDALGCTGLGFLHDEGLGVAQDDAEAARLLGVGCRLGNETACRWAADLASD